MQETLEENIFLLIIMCTGGVSLLVISFVLLFIRNQNKLFKNSQQMHDAEMKHQKELMNVVIQSQEMERKRIGEDLHDDVGGSLSNLRLLINKLDGKSIGTHEMGNITNSFKLLIDKIIADVRNISHSLSPPALALFGFTAALEELSDIINNNSDDESFLTITNQAGAVAENLPYTTALSLIRILQELIANTLKHARATRIDVRVFLDNEQLSLQYTDDGEGYDQKELNKKKGMGMQNIESRANMINATCKVNTAPGQGFSMVITINPME